MRHNQVYALPQILVTHNNQGTDFPFGFHVYLIAGFHIADLIQGLKPVGLG